MSRGLATPRALAFTLAAACFVLLGLIVYRDDPESNPGGFTALSDRARHGFGLWREQNCHVCHQLYGFGGYLGPDLTHVSQRVDLDTFTQILREGTGPMPPIPLDDDERGAIYQFLFELSSSGQGHLTSTATPLSWDQVFSSMSNTTARGVAVFNTLGCGQCHQPFRVGKLASPDLSRTFERLIRLDVDAAIRRGRGNMPSFSSVPPKDMESLLDLLQSLSENRAELSRRDPARMPLPWFNYQGMP